MMLPRAFSFVLLCLATGAEHSDCKGKCQQLTSEVADTTSLMQVMTQVNRADRDKGSLEDSIATDAEDSIATDAERIAVEYEKQVADLAASISVELADQEMLKLASETGDYPEIFRAPKSALYWADQKSWEEDHYVPGSDGTFSQNYQDKWIEAVARHNGWDKQDGFFLDLGAFDGLKCSNSALMEKQFGWKGVCVEPRPVPGAFSDRDCILVERPLSDQSGKEVKFYGVPGTQRQQVDQFAENDPFDAGETMSTLSSSELLSCVNLTDASSTAADSPPCHGVPQKMPLPSFINFISMDLEGQELALLSTFPFDKVKVGAWVIETNQNPGLIEAVDNVMGSNGYMHVPVENAVADSFYIQPQFWHPSLAAKALRDHPPGSWGC